MSSTERDFAATVPGPDEQQDAIALLCDVQKTYRLDAVPVHVIKGVDLLVRPGHFTVLLGPSGSGKTTLLNMIGCIDRPDSGTVQVAGCQVDQLSDDALSDFRARHIGFIFQKVGQRFRRFVQFVTNKILVHEDVLQYFSID